MNDLKKILTGLLFAVTLAVSLTASGGDAYARVKGGGGQPASNGDGIITITLPTPAGDLIGLLGITWE
jgi:hypothetical protein